MASSIKNITASLSEAKEIKYTDTHTIGATDVQSAIDALTIKINALESELSGQTTRLSNINTELETEIGNPV